MQSLAQLNLRDLFLLMKILSSGSGLILAVKVNEIMMRPEFIYWWITDRQQLKSLHERVQAALDNSWPKKIDLDVFCFSV